MRSHPVSLLRIRFLAETTRKMVLAKEADLLLEEWYEIARTLNVREDYFGYFEDSYMGKISSLIDDMLIEANPIKFDEIAQIDNFDFAELIISAWDSFLKDPDNFSTARVKIRPVCRKTSLFITSFY